jgi:hypothetical protein
MSRSQPLVMFSFGYYGWGNSTPQLVQAVDAVERGRGFGPPVFVDVRIRRAVRAEGFRESAFEKLLGRGRYRWLPDLGNEAITRGGKMRIRDPRAAGQLWELAQAAGRHERRVIFFCGCERPMDGRRRACHRTLVADLVLKRARAARAAVEVIEWPGGAPGEIEVDVSPAEFRAIARGRTTISLAKSRPLRNVAGLPWGSIVQVRSEGDTLHRLTGPAVYRRGQWCLDVLDWDLDEGRSRAALNQQSAAARKHFGYDARK